MIWICLKDIYVLLGEIQKSLTENLFFSEDDCHPTLTLLRLLEKTWQQLFLSVINLCLLV